MSTKKEIEDAFDLIKQKFDDPDFKDSFSKYSKNIQLDIKDLNTIYLIKIRNGEIQSIKEEQINSPDIHIILAGKTLIDILNKKINPMKAYTTGKLKAKGKFTDLLIIQKLLK